MGEIVVNANRLHAMAKQQPANTLNEHELSQNFEFGCKVWTVLRQLLRACVCKCMVSAASGGGLGASLYDSLSAPGWMDLQAGSPSGGRNVHPLELQGPV
jgi:hypothetical protein